MENDKLNRDKWAIVREFAVFIFGFLMYFQNKGLVQDIKDEKKSDKEYYRAEKKEQNKTLTDLIKTMDNVLKFKKNYDQVDDTFHFNNDSANRDR